MKTIVMVICRDNNGVYVGRFIMIDHILSWEFASNTIIVLCESE